MERKDWNEIGKNQFVLTPYSVNETINKKIILLRGDMTTLEVDCVVNAANSRLRGGGGIDGAIHSKAGPELFQYLVDHYDFCETGDFKPTPAFKLPSKEILHAVGPIGEQPHLLERCYWKCMHYMKNTNKKTIAFPCISTGIYGYDNNKACPVVLRIIRFWLENNMDWDGTIIFCVFSQRDYDIYKNYLPYYFPTQESTHEMIDTMIMEKIEKKQVLLNTLKETEEKKSIQQIQEYIKEDNQLNEQIFDLTTSKIMLQQIPEQQIIIKKEYNDFKFFDTIEKSLIKRLIILQQERNQLKGETYPIINPKEE